MEVTVVIPTFNRYARIQETLSALKNQDFKGFSVIVVNDGSTEKQYTELGTYCSQLSFQCKVLSQTNAGASAATNNGVRHAADGLIILFDDDIIPSDNCISQHVKFHAQHPGSILSGSADTDPSRTVTDVQRYKLYMEEQWRKRRPDTDQLVTVHFENFIITTANISMPREIFLQLNGFNTGLRDGYDVDFGFRALIRNIPLYFDRNVRSVHNDLISLRYYAGRQRAYTLSKRKIFADYPDLRSRIGEAGEPPVTGMKKLAYALLRKKALVNFMESSIFSWLIPRRLRYRFYGAAIASLSRTQ